jgi:hypothetical protein
MIPFAANQESQSVRYTFQTDVFVILGVSCRDCPGYKYEVKRVTVVPSDPDPWIQAMILDKDGNDIGDTYYMSLGESVTLFGWGECYLQENYKNLRYDWYLETRDGVGPTWSDQEIITITPPKGITRIILAVICLDDPLEPYIEAFDTLVIEANRAKPPVVADQMNTGDIKLNKAKFNGNNDFINITYYPIDANNTVTANIYDLRGRMITKIEGKYNGETVDISWDGRNDNGALQPAGTYIWKLEGDGEAKSGVLILTR